MVSRMVTLPGGGEITYDYSGLDKILQTLKKGEYTKIVADGVAYGIYWELGHVTLAGNFLQHPFLAPALEKWRKPLADALKECIARGDLTLLYAVIDKVAQNVADEAKRQIEMEKDKGLGISSDLIDTAALLNSIIVLDPEDI